MATPLPVRGNSIQKVSHEKQIKKEDLFKPTSMGGFTVEMQISENEVPTHPQEIAI